MLHRVRCSLVAALLVLLGAPLAQAQMTFEQNVNRPGGDIKQFRAGSDPRECQNSCLRETKCAAWTYVKPGGPAGGAVCYLKRAAQAPKPSNCCISGVVRTIGAQPAPGQPAPRDMSRHPVCSSFARAAVGWNNRAKAIGCRPAKPFVGSEGEYYNWCMGTSDAEFRSRSPQALGHKAALEKFCTKQSGATINLN